MNSTLPIAAVAAFCTAVPSLRAQDSVSLLHALPGDAVNAHLASEQINNYVVDQAVLRTSWNTTFGIAPLIKLSEQRAPASAPTFFTGSTGAQAISRLTSASQPFLRSSYMLWSTQGAGVNDNASRNSPGSLVNTSADSGFQFGVACAEFASGTTDPTGANASLNGILGGIVNFKPELPSRLFVSRVVAGVNSPADACNLSQYGMGAVDEDGDVNFRADPGNAPCGGFTSLVGNNAFRVRMQNRASVVNVLSNTGAVDAAATDWLLPHGSLTAWNPPNMIPRSVATRPVLIGSSFAKEYLWEAAAGTLTIVASPHFAGGITDHRGAVAYSPSNFPTLLGALTTSGTGAVLAYGAGAFADNINFWGLDGNGNVTGSIARTLPAVVSDPCEAWSNTDVAGLQEFDHYHSQTAFRGGSSQVALGEDQAGNLLAAAVVYYGSASLPSLQDPNNYIAVARIDPAGATAWSVAAWTASAGAGAPGKTIFQNGTTPIGHLSGVSFGPAMSAPMIDSVGNVWFVGELELLANPGVRTVGLLRSVYNAASFCYTLELVLKQGDVFAGRNSATNYQINFLEINDSNSVGSGTAFSGNISASAFENTDPTTLDVTDPATLGGLVIAAGITYDVNGDGQFIRSTGTNGVPGSPDEDYQVLLYIAGTRDCNENGIPDDRDIFDGISFDVDSNGVLDECEGVIGVPFCFGDGSLVTPCPCGNFGDPGHGCGNSVSSGGALLTGSGTVSPDAVQFTVTDVPPTVGTIYLQGSVQNVNGVVFGDGVRCAAGQLIRLGLKIDSDADGSTTFGPASGDPQVSVMGGVIPGNTYFYQTYYRNPNPGFCPPATFNVSNGMKIAW